MYGAEYVQAILSLPHAGVPTPAAEGDLAALLPTVPAQHEIERDMAQYEHYVANRDSMGGERLPAQGGRA